MPLSEHEQRLLEQMERALHAEDPKLASALRGADLRMHYRRRVLKASVGFLAGLALLVSGVLTQPWVSVLGFLAMLVSAFFALSSWRSIPDATELRVAGPSSRKGARRPPRRKGGLMHRFEDRWNRRRDERGR